MGNSSDLWCAGSISVIQYVGRAALAGPAEAGGLLGRLGGRSWLFKTCPEFLLRFDGRAVSRVPVFEMTALAGFVEVAAGLPQRLRVFLLHNVEHFEGDVAQRLNFRNPQHGVLLELRLNLRWR